jgi:hypothetical protein
VPANVQRVAGPAPPKLTRDDLILVCLVRNGEAHVEDFLTHHFGLGIRHAVLLDNGSTDRTVQIAQAFDGVTVLSTGLPYKHYKFALKRYLFDFHSGDGWCLILDIDERFEYPRSRVLPLKEFLAYLNQRQFTGVELTAHSIWYDHASLSKWRYAALDGNTISHHTIMSHSGGVRLAAFGLNVSLTKHPLLRKAGGARPSNHSSQWCTRARIADVTCVLLHYKFDRDFLQKCREVARAETYFMNSLEYKTYLRELERNPRLELKGPSAKELRSIDQLIDDGFLVVSDDYERVVSLFRNRSR